jgi:L-glyceraldehyde 3-phosphate reductase
MIMGGSTAGYEGSLRGGRNPSAGAEPPEQEKGAAGVKLVRVMNTENAPAYEPSPARYDDTSPGWFRRCGRSGLHLPAISIGCWHNFGDPGTDAARHADEASLHDNARAMLFTAFDHGITHFDLANNYGPAPGAAEARVGRILKEDFPQHRDELIVSTKAGYRMWPGPYGEWGSRKYLLASLDQSLQRLQLDYVDIFYSHRFDPTRRSKKRWARSTRPCVRARRCTRASRPTTASRPGGSRRSVRRTGS